MDLPLLGPMASVLVASTTVCNALQRETIVSHLLQSISARECANKFIVHYLFLKITGKWILVLMFYVSTIFSPEICS